MLWLGTGDGRAVSLSPALCAPVVTRSSQGAPTENGQRPYQGTHGAGKTGKMAKIIPCQGKHREFGNFVKTQGILSKHRENTGNFVSSSCKCPDSRSKGYCDSCCKKIHFFPEAG